MSAAQLFLNAFTAVAIDPDMARNAARNYSSVSTWTASQATQTALVGAGALIVPGVHILGMGVDLTMVLHKMGWTTWGVGQLVGADLEGKLDLALTLGIWSGVVTDDMIAAAVIAAGAGVLVKGIMVTGPAVFMASIASKIAGASVAAILAEMGVSKGVAKGMGKVAGKLAGPAATNLANKIVAKLSPKAAAVLAGGTAGKAIPIVGALIGAGVNVWIINSISSSAEKYYRAKARTAQ
ncbi:hypothetical protein [Streptosporangium sp. V21-05]|uniref:hypothetical protein n=1 Tax=Streptosporangium sp. V21-05 TaxID=3446115 RepID=UPI003F52B67B